MPLRNRILAAALAVGAVVLPAASYAAVYVDIAPPAPQVEVVPAPRVGYVWAPGYYRWNGHRHVWVSGYWVHERRGYHYAPSAWVQRNGHWYFQGGGWRH